MILKVDAMELLHNDVRVPFYRRMGGMSLCFDQSAIGDSTICQGVEVDNEGA